MKKTVVAIGEMLWDVFLDGKKAGGSSMNVALNLHKQDINSLFISAVGDDQHGRDLLRYLENLDFPTQLIQTNNLPTSTVEVKLDEEQQASYTIVEPVAWDEIVVTKETLRAVENADAFVYCSLTCRNEKSRKTIFKLLEIAKIKVFDINLREPFYTLETLVFLLRSADILKVNEHELIYLKENLRLSGSSDEQLLQQLSINFSVSIICLTVGEKGAFVFYKDKLYLHPGYPIKVSDTVGAGDAFLATFVASYLTGYSMEEILARSCRVGAFVASQKGANPAYNMEIFKA